jgi:peptidoglycan/xylan/chitin deacetylase (PgdA/CDA1 family)
VVSASRVGREAGFVALVLAVLLGAWAGGSWLRAASAPPPPEPVYRVATTAPEVALAVNVVWGTEYVPQMLRVLQQNHAQATFFLGGAWAAAHPALARGLATAGMEIGNHGYAHRHQSTLSFDANLAEITRATRAIELATGVRPTLFAPPYGEYNATVLAAAAALHMPVIMWTIDTIDWRPDSSPGLIVQRVLGRVAPGAIILMHPTERTVDALPSLLKALAERGYRVVGVQQLLAAGRPAGE